MDFSASRQAKPPMTFYKLPSRVSTTAVLHCPHEAKISCSRHEFDSDAYPQAARHDAQSTTTLPSEQPSTHNARLSHFLHLYQLSLRHRKPPSPFHVQCVAVPPTNRNLALPHAFHYSLAKRSSPTACPPSSSISAELTLSLQPR